VQRMSFPPGTGTIYRDFATLAYQAIDD